MDLSLHDVHVNYGPSPALRGVSFTVRGGEIVALLGANGSGKSTALAVAAGLLEPLSGTVTLGGLDPKRQPLEYARRLGYVPQERSLFDDLTAVQNLEFFGQIHGIWGRDLSRRVARGLTRARLLDRADEPIRKFSGGMAQRLGIACALIHDPDVLLLDEPTAALDAASRDDLWRELHRLRDDGCTIVMTSHDANEVDDGCDRAITLEEGRVSAALPSRIGAGLWRALHSARAA